MNIDNEKLKEKIKKYHEMLRNNEDTSSIKAEIDAFTKVYAETTSDKIKSIKEEKHTIEQNEIVLHNAVDKKDYRRLIELYRSARELMNNISNYKKHLRDVMKKENKNEVKRGKNEIKR